jgi:nicotinate-nucleotide adenylyltransferase
MVLQIALFGTSADPPTYGHLEILTWLSKRYDRTAVWASDNPFKRDQTPLDDRTEMLRLLVTLSGESLETLQVYPELSDLRTIITYNRAVKVWPNAKFTFVLGADLLPQLPTWYQAKELLAAVDLLVIPRSGYQILDSTIDKIKSLGGTLEIANLITPNVSSSAYRYDMAPNTVPTIVQSYIQQQELYPCPIA